MKFEIKNRFTGNVQFSCELSAEVAGKSYAFQLGFAVKSAIEAKANLSFANLSSANLRSADLSFTDLRSADLSFTDLSFTDLSFADLSFTDLSSADLSSANLSSANLRSADLNFTDLRSADLSFTDLSFTNLSSANLSSANLRFADLSFANLSSADLSSADLSSANLRSANLSFANLRSAKKLEMAIALTRILPEGDLIGWKKCRDDVIVKLRIPEAAKRCHAFGRKCRAEFADVIEVIGAEHGVSMHDGKTKYVAGTRVTPDSFNEDFTNECSNGVHFYITKLEAEAHS